MSKKHYDKSSGSRCSADDVTYKRIRLTDLKRGRYASTNAIAHLLDTVCRQGIPECSSASAQRRARVALCSQATPFGPIVQQLEVPAKHDPARAPTNVSIPYQNPLAMLHVSVHECEPLAELMRDAVRTHGEPSLAAPWRLIWYFMRSVRVLWRRSTRVKRTARIGRFWNLVHGCYARTTVGLLRRLSDPRR